MGTTSDAVPAHIDTIVVPLDGSAVARRAVPVARALAQRTGADVTLVTSTFDGKGATRAELDEAAAAFEGIETRTVTLDDRSAADTAVDLTLAAEGGLLCFATHGRGSLGRTVLGSVADDVITTGAVASLVVGPACDLGALSSPGPVTLCVDGSFRSEVVVEVGRRWATLLERDGHLVLVSHPMDPTTGPESPGTFDELIGPYAGEHPHLDGTCTLNRSVPVGLADEAEQVKSPLMVIAPAPRSLWRRLLIGSTTLGILTHAPCPVLVLAESTTTEARADR